jgi:hypothetical protein
MASSSTAMLMDSRPREKAYSHQRRRLSRSTRRAYEVRLTGVRHFPLQYLRRRREERHSLLRVQLNSRL